MGAQKLTRDELLLRCANTIKRLGYHGATIEALASACGLSKGAFYHHYSNKEMLALDVLKWTHERIAEKLFSIAYEEGSSVVERMERMNRRTQRLFREDSSGCLMGIVSIDAVHGVEGLVPLIKSFFDAWIAALSHLFAHSRSQGEAREIAEQLVADYEGALLLDRLYGRSSQRFLDRVAARALTELRRVPGSPSA